MTLVAAVAAATVVASVLVYRLALREIDALQDYHLRQIALSLADQVPSRREATDGQLDFVIQIWSSNGEQLYLSSAGTDLPEVAQLGFATVSAPGGDWRVFSAQLGGEVIQVGQPVRIRQERAFAAAVRTIAPVILILPLLTIAVWWLVGRALAPFGTIARSLGSRTPATLEPIVEDGVPEEALPLVRSLNDLLARLATALAAQRAFVADAAHELRTPLAALELQAQLVARASDPQERSEAVSALRGGLDRAAHLVAQLLTLARAEPDAPVTGEPVHLDELVAQTIADHALVAEARRVDLGAQGTAADAVVHGDGAGLRALLGNLVENAIRHAREGGRVDVAAGVSGGRPYLEVVDDGPGIPDAERTHVFDRFYRRRSGPEPGTGLGLAIVKAVAERHGATVSLGDTPGGGLTVRVEFPARGAEPATSQTAERAPGAPSVEDARA